MAEPEIDTLAPKITVRCMTLLQTRVDDQTARRFERAAKERGCSPYSYLQELVKVAAAQPEPPGWEGHRQRLASLKRKPLPYNTVAHDREAAGER